MGDGWRRFKVYLKRALVESLVRLCVLFVVGLFLFCMGYVVVLFWRFLW